MAFDLAIYAHLEKTQYTWKKIIIFSPTYLHFDKLSWNVLWQETSNFFINWKKSGIHVLFASVVPTSCPITVQRPPLPPKLWLVYFLAMLARPPHRHITFAAVAIRRFSPQQCYSNAWNKTIWFFTVAVLHTTPSRIFKFKFKFFYLWT